MPVAWMEDAACVGLDVDLFYPPPSARLPRTVRRMCEGCPVRVECLEFALAAEDALDHRSAVSRHGWWGGLGPRERAALAAGRQRPARVSAHGTEARYRRQGCRCEACRAAAALADRNRRGRRRQAA